MADNLTSLIARVQAMLLDAGTVFSTATCTAAIRQALIEFNQRVPNTGADLVDVVAGQKEYALNASSMAGLLSVLGVWLQGTDEADELLSADLYFEDNAPFLRLREARAAGILIVRYTVPYTISGLDSAVESTLTADQEQVLVDGACAAAIAIRAVARVETINLAPDVVERYKLSMTYYRRVFEIGLALYAGRRAAVGEPDAHVWNDPYFNFFP
jgi:hypothetical protein